MEGKDGAGKWGEGGGGISPNPSPSPFSPVTGSLHMLSLRLLYRSNPVSMLSFGP